MICKICNNFETSKLKILNQIFGLVNNIKKFVDQINIIFNKQQTKFKYSDNENDNNNIVASQIMMCCFENIIKYDNYIKKLKCFGFLPYLILNDVHIFCLKKNMSESLIKLIFDDFFSHINVQNFIHMNKILNKYNVNIKSCFVEYLNDEKYNIFTKLFLDENINVYYYNEITKILKNIISEFDFNEINLLNEYTDFSYEKIVYMMNNNIDLNYYKQYVKKYLLGFLNKNDDFNKSYDFYMILIHIQLKYSKLNINFFDEYFDNKKNTFAHIVLYEIIKMHRSNKSNKSTNDNHKSNKLQKIFETLLTLRFNPNIYNKNNESVATIWNDHKKMFNSEFKLLDKYFNANKSSSESTVHQSLSESTAHQSLSESNAHQSSLESNPHQSMSKNFIREYNEKNSWIFTFFNRTIY